MLGHEEPRVRFLHRGRHVFQRAAGDRARGIENQPEQELEIEQADEDARGAQVGRAVGMVARVAVGEARDGDEAGEQHEPAEDGMDLEEEGHVSEVSRSRRETSDTPFTRRTALMIFSRCARFSTSTSAAPATRPSVVLSSSERMSVPVSLTACARSAYNPRRSDASIARRITNRSPSLSCQSMSSLRSGSCARNRRFGQSPRWMLTPRPRVTYPTTLSPGTG